ncbi:helix-turn-helix domain-containing protein [Snodgrassella sp. B3800]|uniref:RodZ domain-containing protein n=1 Tax=Snodgrassella sp. B3800 TaxID=2818039 RepID=UPI00226A7178|nr:RodZ domain-containing protein [Snodgrassella sp. B3800]MCX8745880.1 helix-turn-helix domain-containing protein [Snodgrassella sp. B3800]
MNEQTKNLDSSPNAAVTLGALLSQARKQKGLSVGEVAERLKLPARQIEAMESGSYKGLPEAVFIKGFLSSYARLLELDESEFKQYLQQIFPSGQRYSTSDSSKVLSSELDFQDKPQRRHFPRWLIALLVLIIIGAVVYAWQSKSTSENAKQAATASQEVSAQTASISDIAASNIRVVPMPASEQVSSTASTTVISASQLQEANTKTNASEPVAADSEALLIKLENKSWLQVSDKNGKVLISQVVDAGSTQQFSGSAPYKVIIGYTPGASIKFAGKDVIIPQNKKRTAVVMVGGN